MILNVKPGVGGEAGGSRKNRIGTQEGVKMIVVIKGDSDQKGGRLGIQGGGGERNGRGVVKSKSELGGGRGREAGVRAGSDGKTTN